MMPLLLACPDSCCGVFSILDAFFPAGTALVSATFALHLPDNYPTMKPGVTIEKPLSAG